MDHAYAALLRIPQFEDTAREDVTFQRLGGLTNLIYRVTVKGSDYCLRIPGEGTEDYIDRSAEWHNAQVAGRLGVSPRVLYFAGDGLMVAEYLDDRVTMTPARFVERAGAPARAAVALKKLHTSGESFQSRFELFGMIDNYLGVVQKLGAALPDGYDDVLREAEAVRRVLNERLGQLAPCHCDPLSENFLDDGERMWIVDWEYSGMNDPAWDLGDLSVEAALGPTEEQELMEAYCGGKVPPAFFGRVVIYKAMCDLLWTLWGLIQHANKNPVDDFLAYAHNRFERCKALMATPDFQRQLEAVRKGE